MHCQHCVAGRGPGGDWLQAAWSWATRWWALASRSWLNRRTSACQEDAKRMILDGGGRACPRANQSGLAWRQTGPVAVTLSRDIQRLKSKRDNRSSQGPPHAGQLKPQRLIDETPAAYQGRIKAINKNGLVKTWRRGRWRPGQQVASHMGPVAYLRWGAPVAARGRWHRSAWTYGGRDETLARRRGPIIASSVGDPVPPPSISRSCRVDATAPIPHAPKNTARL